MNGRHVYVFFITYLFDFSLANDVVGCGGFLKSHVPIDFSKVEVKLVTKQGIIKDRTTAAPNNGYYFVPLYDKGEMVLELAPPPGWSFEPKQVEINIDGVNDLCSQGKDINFVFQGFGITGKVESLGSSNTGPKGVTVHLQSKEENRTTITDEGGNFFFTPVYPGLYKVSISHPRWKIFRNSIDVQVAESNAELQKNSLIVQGYEVVGKVTSDGEPVKGVTILLFSQENRPVLVHGCIKGTTEVSQNNKSLCLAITDDNGVFQFGVVPNGRYYVTAHFQKQNFHYRPTRIEFEVNNGDAILDQHFEIIGFSIPGKVLKSRGKPVPNAKIYVNGQEVTKTDNEGAYKLEKMKAGTYRMKVEAEDLTFDEKMVRVSPSHQELPDMLPSAFKVCGMVTSGQSQTVTFTPLGSSQTVAVVQAQSSTRDGGFCHFLPPGRYDVQVVVGQDESRKGLQFFPLKHTIEVTSEEITDLIFSQLKATVFGKVKCLQPEKCEGLSVVVKSDNTEDIIVKVQGGSFKLEDIFPGVYKVSLSPNRFCWESSKSTLNINSATVDVTFTQIGYTLNLLLSHDAKVHYHLKTETKSSSIEAKRGRSTVCLPKPGEYEFTVDSCHSYNMNSFSYDTDDEGANEIALNAEKHIQAVCIKADRDFGEIRVAVKIAERQPFLTTLNHKDGCYRLELMLHPEETALVRPESDTLFFTPATLSVHGKEDCSDLGVKFVAVQGKVFQGRVVPPLEGVVLTVESSDSDTLVAETDARGFYRFPPLDGGKQYKIQAAKESYVLIGPDENGDFLARKLAEVIVEVVDSGDDGALAGVLLSLSGGDGYRKNLQSGEDGKITFHSLSPSEYFLRPMMKEYVFEPNSKIIPVNEGQTVHVRLVGKRVAYSAYGKVVSLNGEPEENMVIVAKGIANCTMYSEETSSEFNGQFRIRGLHPYCSYVVEVKNNQDAAAVAATQGVVERSVPERIPINHIKEDARDLKLVVFRGATQTDILVRVYSANVDHYKSLKVKLFRESGSSAMTAKIDAASVKLTKAANPGLMIYMPSVPLDNASYSLQLESSLLVQNKKWQYHDFLANTTFKYFELDFSPKSNIIDQPIRQTSIWTLLFIFVVLVVVYNVQAVAGFLKDRFDFNLSNLANFIPSPSSSQKSTGDYFDDADIDQIVQSINNTKKKPKAKGLKK
ncbi:unnamed protein product [Callosobruchus maculatus]|uniref:ER membrane protein complex subunit 7 beta-sandwich domain-containing protein n=1 Tax=Callosobruchus maculatus TaxID=64391 RepID=A0A653D1R0_CALMS|nr:unnamed protein product [Callosobruchus maculatus]